MWAFSRFVGERDLRKQNQRVKFCGACGARLEGPFCGSCGRPATPTATGGFLPAQGAEAPGQEALAPSDASPASLPTGSATPATDEGQVRGGAHAPLSPESEVPPQPPPLQPSPVGASGGPRRPTAALAAALVIALITAGAVGAAAWRQGWFSSPAAPRALSTRTVTTSPSSASTPDPVDESQSPAPTPTPTPTGPSPVALRAAALAELEQIVADDRKQTPVRGQWVAQLASKTEGIVDTKQQMTPFTLPDILAEIKSLQLNEDYGTKVRVVHQGDWGGTKSGSKPMWVTVADIDVASKADVVAWCNDHFDERGTDLLNVCYPRRLKLKS